MHYGNKEEPVCYSEVVHTDSSAVFECNEGFEMRYESSKEKDNRYINVWVSTPAYGEQYATTPLTDDNYDKCAGGECYSRSCVQS